MSRLTLSDRVAIESGIYEKLSLKEIAKKIGRSPGTVSREIKQNRTIAEGTHPFGNNCLYALGCTKGNLCGREYCSRRCVTCAQYDCKKLCNRYDDSPCSALLRPPYVCNTCPKRRNCKVDRAYYISRQADEFARKRYSNSRSKIQKRGDELEQIDQIVSPLILKGQPLTHIWSEHGEEIGISQRTLYRYIDQGVLSIGNIDLRRKVAYRPRKKKKESSERFMNQNFRKNRGYSDYLKYMEKHSDTSVVQMDTVKGVREQGKRMLTLHFCDTNLMLILLMRDCKADTVVEQFDMLTNLLGVEEFRKIFPVILTDNGSEFKHTKELETAENGQKRTRIFYCDPQASWQKPKIEKNHEFIRYVLPKGTNFSPFTQEDMIVLMNNINSVRRDVLKGKSPYEVVKDKSILRMMRLMNLHYITADEVDLTPKLLKK